MTQAERQILATLSEPIHFAGLTVARGTVAVYLQQEFGIEGWYALAPERSQGRVEVGSVEELRARLAQG